MSFFLFILLYLSQPVLFQNFERRRTIIRDIKFLRVKIGKFSLQRALSKLRHLMGVTIVIYLGFHGPEHFFFVYRKSIKFACSRVSAKFSLTTAGVLNFLRCRHLFCQGRARVFSGPGSCLSVFSSSVNSKQSLSLFFF